jgi:tetratricopeptide (TPR) repeat protein
LLEQVLGTALLANDTHQSAGELLQLAIDNPVVLAARAADVARILAQAGHVPKLAERTLPLLASASADVRAARLALLGRCLAWGDVLPADAANALSPLLSLVSPPEATQLARCLVACGSHAAALQAVSIASEGQERGPELRALCAAAAIGSGHPETIRMLRDATSSAGDGALLEVHLAFAEHAEARALIRQVPLDGAEPWTLLLAARTHIELGDADSADDALERLAAPTATRVLLTARILLLLEDPQAARRHLDRLLTSTPWWPEAMYRAGCAMALANDTRAATELLMKSRHPRAALLLAELARRQGDAALAKGALDVARSAQTPEPGTLIAACKLAIALRDPSRGEEILRRLRPLAAQASGKPTSIIEQLSGAVAELEGRLDVAQAHYVRAEAWGRAGLLSLMRGDIATATQHLERVSTPELANVTSVAVLSAVAVTSTDLARADLALSRAIVIAPDDPRQRVDLASVRLVRVGQILAEGGADAESRARELLQSTLAATGDPRVVTASLELLLVRAARVARGAAGDTDRLRTELGRLRTARPDDARLAEMMGALFVRAARYEDAVRELEPTARAGSAIAAHLVGLAQQALGNREAALRAFAQSAKSSDRTVATLSWLAIALANGDDAGVGTALARASREG